ncbi:hypothetical protein NQZ68_037188 [Dissostichus eleginoides]|nr:hypothetical protein NQZ68_037188 [Dissostichus eleginoides]
MDERYRLFSTNSPPQTRRNGRSSHSGCDWFRRACSAAVLPPKQHHWLACIRARRCCCRILRC